MSNRDYKFRAWDAENKAFVSAGGVQEQHIPVVPTEHGFALKTKFLLSMWTGLLDKNGQEIYEGDIVQYAYDWDHEDAGLEKRIFKKPTKRNKPSIGVIEWSGGEHAEFVVNPDRMCLSNEEMLIEVVGNVFENPELIPKRKGKVNADN